MSIFRTAVLGSYRSQQLLALPSGGRGRRFKSSHPDHLLLFFQRPVAVVPDCLPQETLLDTLMTQLRSQNGYDPQERQPL